MCGEIEKWQSVNTEKYWNNFLRVFLPDFLYFNPSTFVQLGKIAKYQKISDIASLR